MSSRADLLAQEAARRLAAGEASSIDGALGDAVAAFNAEDWPHPTTTRIRRHLELATASAIGQKKATQQTAGMMHSVIEVADALAWSIDDLTVIAVGRLAQGYIDRWSPVHLRIHTTAAVSRIADVLSDHDCPDPVVSSQTTPTGPLDRVECVVEGLTLSILKVRNRTQLAAQTNLISGRPIAVVSMETLREMATSDPP